MSEPLVIPAGVVVGAQGMRVDVALVPGAWTGDVGPTVRVGLWGVDGGVTHGHLTPAMARTLARLLTDLCAGEPA